jgi:hypothetical protein
MFSGNNKESIITVNNDYNHTNPFIVQDINSDNTVARQLYKQLKAPRRRGLTQIRVLLAKVKEY